MNIIKRTLYAVLAVATLSTTGITFSTAPANAWHYGTAHGHYKAPKKCHWGWVRWKDNYGNWHRKWKKICR